MHEKILYEVNSNLIDFLDNDWKDVDFVTSRYYRLMDLVRDSSEKISLYLEMIQEEKGEE